MLFHLLVGTITIPEVILIGLHQEMEHLLLKTAGELIPEKTDITTYHTMIQAY